jgi:hypothetical protein
MQIADALRLVGAELAAGDVEQPRLRSRIEGLEPPLPPELIAAKETAEITRLSPLCWYKAVA